MSRLPGRSGLGGCDVAAFSSRGSADSIRVDWDETRRRSGQGVTGQHDLNRIVRSSRAAWWNQISGADGAAAKALLVTP